MIRKTQRTISNTKFVTFYPFDRSCKWHTKFNVTVDYVDDYITIHIHQLGYTHLGCDEDESRRNDKVSVE